MTNFHSILPVEVKQRDLRSRSILACALAKEFGTSFIGYKPTAENLAYYSPPSVFISRAVEKRDWYPRLLHKLQEAGTLRCVHDVEAGAALFTPDVFREVRAPIAAVSLLDYWAAWSYKESRIMEDHFFGKTNCEVVTVGKPGWSRPSGIKPLCADDQRILVCLSTTVDSINKREFWRAPSVIKERISDESIFNGYLDSMRNRARLNEELLELCLCANKCNFTVVLRPHPSETDDGISRLEEMFKENGNIVIDNKSLLKDSIHECRFLINAECMTSYDAIANGRIPLNLQNKTKDKDANKQQQPCFGFTSILEIVEFLESEKWSDEKYAGAFEKMVEGHAKEIPSFATASTDLALWEPIFRSLHIPKKNRRNLFAAVSAQVLGWLYSTYESLRDRDATRMVSIEDVQKALVEDADVLHDIHLRTVCNGVAFYGRGEKRRR